MSFTLNICTINQTDTPPFTHQVVLKDEGYPTNLDSVIISKIALPERPYKTSCSVKNTTQYVEYMGQKQLQIEIEQKEDTENLILNGNFLTMVTRTMEL